MNSRENGPKRYSRRAFLRNAAFLAGDAVLIVSGVNLGVGYKKEWQESDLRQRATDLHFEAKKPELTREQAQADLQQEGQLIFEAAKVSDESAKHYGLGVMQFMGVAAVAIFASHNIFLGNLPEEAKRKQN